ncbi:unnamed protein product, partial [marine sediment metagenome]
ELELNSETIFKQVKQRGTATYSGYWINMTLMAVPETENLIVIDGLEEGDLKSCSIIQPIEISKNKEECNNDERIVIENNVDLKAFKEKIKTLAKTLSKK